jgi:diacylglycerol O-acyltransferase / wax synthase
MSHCIVGNRPLWQLTFVDGLDNGRVALIEKLHHSMADGVAALAYEAIRDE